MSEQKSTRGRAHGPIVRPHPSTFSFLLALLAVLPATMVTRDVADANGNGITRRPPHPRRAAAPKMFSERVLGRHTG